MSLPPSATITSSPGVPKIVSPALVPTIVAPRPLQVCGLVPGDRVASGQSSPVHGQSWACTGRRARRRGRRRATGGRGEGVQAKEAEAQIGRPANAHSEPPVILDLAAESTGPARGLPGTLVPDSRHRQLPSARRHRQTGEPRARARISGIPARRQQLAAIVEEAPARHSRQRHPRIPVVSNTSSASASSVASTIIM